RDAVALVDGRSFQGGGGADLACQKLPVGGQRALDLPGPFPNELDAKSSDPELEQTRDQRRGALGERVEDGVAAADVDDHGMVVAGIVTERDAMLFARAPAGSVVGAVAQEVGIHAVRV